ncbi:MAG: M3 family metallopeptidase [Muribaculaceae bacterium]|nr:M3 family metallopeptidase [Muribaculaceae bacterium]
MKKTIVSILAATVMTTGSIHAQAVNDSKNPVLAPSGLPYNVLPFDKISAAYLEEAVKEGIDYQNKAISAIVNQRSVPTFENTIAAFDRSSWELNRAVLALSNLEGACGDEAYQTAMQNITPLLSEHSANILLNERLFERIKQVYDNRDKAVDLTPEEKRLITETYADFADNGAALKGEDRDKYRKLNAELSDLNLKFSQNVTNGMKDKARRMFITEKEAAGLPESIKTAAKAEADAAFAEEGKSNDQGLYLITVFAPSYGPFMKYADNRELREKLYRLYNSRNMEGEYSNVEILKDIANVRLEIAKLLGHKNFAEYRLGHTMAANPETVMEFLGNLKASYTEPMRKEIAEVQEFARKSEGPDFVLMPWDYAYWFDKLKNEKYAFNDEDMKPYFELNNTIDGVFGLATKLYGYTFKRNKSIPTYHPDAEAFEVYDRNGDILGVLYTDFYYRPGKGSGAWMTEFNTETKDDEGNRNVPVISIVMNFSKPVGNDPVLLTPSEVETFLHEFGHALHGLSSQAKYSSLSGTNVYHDFVELFSQFNENYLTEQKFLDTFAKHYKTGKKMPKELIDKFVTASQFGAAYRCMRQLGFGYIDMAYHMIEDPLRASQDIAVFEGEAMKPVKVFDMVEGCLTSPQFGHIFSGGYASGYYGYKWAESLDADAFAAFQENGIFDRKTAEKFHKMLESGGTVDPMELYIEFRGKKPTVDALLKRDGIK